MIKVLIFKQQNCAPCKTLTDSIVSERENNLDPTDRWDENVTFIYYDMTDASDQIMEEAIKYNVRSAPTVVVLDANDSVYYSGTMVKTVDKIKELVKEAKNV